MTVPTSGIPATPSSPGAVQSLGAEELLQSAADDLRSLDRRPNDESPVHDRTGVNDQIAVYERIHSSLAKALAQTSESGSHPGGPGQPGA